MIRVRATLQKLSVINCMQCVQNIRAVGSCNRTNDALTHDAHRTHGINTLWPTDYSFDYSVGPLSYFICPVYPACFQNNKPYFNVWPHLYRQLILFSDVKSHLENYKSTSDLPARYLFMMLLI